MEKKKVILLRVRSYDDTIYEKIRKGIDLLGGCGAFFKKEEKILVKPNVLNGAGPEKAVTTHPAVLDAVLRLLTEEGFTNLTAGDSPGMSGGPEKAFTDAGLKAVSDRYGVPMGDFATPVKVKFPEGKVCREFVLAKAAAEADAILSICKMKTHALENITGAVKNQYGCVCGRHKAAGHALYPDSAKFAGMLVDLDMLLRPRLYIMDGVIAMEGNGPSSGDPIPMGLILLSEDPVALDTVFSMLISLPPESVPTCAAGSREGLGTMNPEEITVITEDGEITPKEAAEKYGKPDFKVKREKPHFWNIGFFFPRLKKKKDRPVVDLSLCIGCGICEEACPVEGKAVHSGGGKKAVYDYKKCIRCYCCQEMCPKKAIRKE